MLPLHHISNYAEEVVVFGGETGAAEKKNELLRNQWPERYIESAAREFRTREIECLHA